MEKIKLFGYDLFIFERTVNDYYKFLEYAKQEKTSEIDIFYGDALFVEQSLKRNLEKDTFTFFLFGNQIRIPKHPFRYFQLKYLLRAKYLMNNLSRAEIKNLIKKIYFVETGEELPDDNNSSEKKTDKKPPSRERLEWLIHHFGNFSFAEIKEMNISDFFQAVDNAIAIAGIYAGNGYEFQSGKEKKDEFLEQVEHFKKLGMLN